MTLHYLNSGLTAWQTAEKRMDIIGHNGGTGEHYE
jgi:hypothetical protein